MSEMGQNAQRVKIGQDEEEESKFSQDPFTYIYNLVAASHLALAKKAISREEIKSCFLQPL